MSTYTHRYIEVEIECIDGSVWNKENLPSASKHEGEVWKVTNYRNHPEVSPYYVAKEAPGITFDESTYIWKPLDKVEKKWVPVKWYGFLPKNKVLENHDPYYKPKYVVAKDGNGKEMFLEENLLWCNNGGFVRDDYISSHGLSSHKFANRGLPSDVSEEVKADIESEKYNYDKTWVDLDEWEVAFEAAKEKFMKNVQLKFEKMNKKDISDKLDTILATIKDPNYKPKKKKKEEDEDYYYEDTIEYLFEEDIWELFNIQMEIDRTEFIVEQFDNHYSHFGTRIIYYLA